MADKKESEYSDHFILSLMLEHGLGLSKLLIGGKGVGVSFFLFKKSCIPIIIRL